MIVWTADYADFRRWAVMPRALLSPSLSERGLRVLSELGWVGLKDGQDAPPLYPPFILIPG